MANTQDLKRRIRSVKNTEQVTKAMKMVAAAKLRRAQERMMQARPYHSRVWQVLRSLASRADTTAHPLLLRHGDQRVETVVVTADKGLCGAFNSGIIRTAEIFMREQRERDLQISCLGKKGRDYFARTHDLQQQWIDKFRKVEFHTAQEIADELMKRYRKHEVDVVVLVYNEFKSALRCKPVVQQLLPIEPTDFKPGEVVEDYIYEPSARELFDSLLPHHVHSHVFHAMLESAAAEHAARMNAMGAASKNAGELIDSLTLTMNRVRQASITTEIIEVVSGAEALG